MQQIKSTNPAVTDEDCSLILELTRMRRDGIAKLQANLGTKAIAEKFGTTEAVIKQVVERHKWYF
ncbi:hypothetical protein D3C85_377520 [compost metagenome]